jgi:hypothetical protein
LAGRPDRAGRMAGRHLATGPVPSCRRHAATSYSTERRIDRSPRSIPQSSRPR